MNQINLQVNKMKIINPVFLIFSIILLSSLSLSLQNTSKNVSLNHTSHLTKDTSSEVQSLSITNQNSKLFNQSIYIYTNAEFATCICVTSGDGSASTPYIIANYILNNGNDIYIDSTTSYFRIENVSVIGSPVDGITVNNVTNGIFQNVSSSFNAGYGFYIFNSSDCYFSNSYAFNNQEQGLFIYEAQYLVFYNMNVYNNNEGFYLAGGDSFKILNSNFFNNTIEIQLEYLNDSIIQNNNFEDNGSFSTKGLWLQFSYNNTVLNNSANNSGYGFQVDSSKYNLLLSNTASYSKYGAGFISYYAMYNNFTLNTAKYNYEGFDIESSSNNFFLENIANTNHINYINYQVSNNTYINNDFYHSNPIPSDTNSVNIAPNTNTNFTGLPIAKTILFLLTLLIIEIIVFNFISGLKFLKRKLF